jgi:hypothetical protein
MIPQVTSIGNVYMYLKKIVMLCFYKMPDGIYVFYPYLELIHLDPSV